MRARSWAKREAPRFLPTRGKLPPSLFARALFVDWIYTRCTVRRFRNNELKGATNAKKSPKHGSSVSPQHSVATANGTEADYQAITHDIKRSVEYVIKKHMRANPNLQLQGSEVEQMLFGSQLDSPSRDNTEGGFPSFANATPHPSMIIPSPRRASEEGSQVLRPVPEESAHGLAAGSVSAPVSVVSAVPATGPLLETVGQLRRRQSKTNEPTAHAGKHAEVSPATPVSSATTDAPAKAGVLSSLSGFFGSNKVTPTPPNSQRVSAPRMKNKQINSLVPIVDVDEAEASYAEVQEELQRREEIQRAETALREASERLNALSATKVRLFCVLRSMRSSIVLTPAMIIAIVVQGEERAEDLAEGVRSQGGPGGDRRR
jgi:hypothetical protein